MALDCRKNASFTKAAFMMCENNLQEVERQVAFRDFCDGILSDQA
jgi:hypothetical protein